MLPAGARERCVDTNGVTLHVVEAGPREGLPVVLLHGFPEFWYGWRAQLPALAAAGLRLIVPDQRGYNTSSKPRGISSYGIERLAADVLGLLDESGERSACVVGHDWGALVGWWLALAHPERVERLAVLNVPHPAVMRRQLATNPRQALRSWYVLLFQLPGLPEALLRRRDFAMLARAVRGGRRGTCSDADLARYREAWAQPGALRAMVDWYRAAPRVAVRPLPALRVRVPTLLLWGARDRFLGLELAAPSAALCDKGVLHVYEQATHWLQHDEAASVNQRLIEFARGGLAAAR
jgi:pimeloyl-ACP methyl ester carboxylesterase